MEVSSTSIKVASVTVSAINHGLCLGCHPSTEEWCTRRAGFGCGASVAVTNAYPGTGSLFLDCTKLWPATAPPIPRTSHQVGTSAQDSVSSIHLLLGLVPIPRNDVVLHRMVLFVLHL